MIHFATAIVCVTEKQVGFILSNQSHLARKGLQLKERLILEVGKSVEIAYHMMGILEEYRIPLEIHADINTDKNSGSYVALKEALSYIKGMGFHYKLKDRKSTHLNC